MQFPETRHSLIARLAEHGSQEDWCTFHRDYQVPICRFAERWGRLSREDAEDVAAEVFQVLLTGGLLARWHRQPCSKLRTLMCGVTKNLIANRARVAYGRRRILRELVQNGTVPDFILSEGEPASESEDSFYAEWVDFFLGQVVDHLLRELHAEGKGDYFRALYGRVCENRTHQQVADYLGISVTMAENYFKAARKRLTATVETRLRQHVREYCGDDGLDEEYDSEFDRMSAFVRGRGGLEALIRDRNSALVGKCGPAEPRPVLHQEGEAIS